MTAFSILLPMCCCYARRSARLGPAEMRSLRGSATEIFFVTYALDCSPYSFFSFVLFPLSFYHFLFLLPFFLFSLRFPFFSFFFFSFSFHRSSLETFGDRSFSFPFSKIIILIPNDYICDCLVKKMIIIIIIIIMKL